MLLTIRSAASPEEETRLFYLFQIIKASIVREDYEASTVATIFGGRLHVTLYAPPSPAAVIWAKRIRALRKSHNLTLIPTPLPLKRQLFARRLLRTTPTPKPHHN